MAKDLYTRLADAEANNRTLVAALAGYEIRGWRGIRLGARPHMILGLLATGKVYSTNDILTALQARFPREDDRSPSTVAVNMSRIRAALRAVDPPISIASAGWRGYWIDPENCLLLEARRLCRGPRGEVPP